jgi:hypothetical protein
MFPPQFGFREMALRQLAASGFPAASSVTVPTLITVRTSSKPKPIRPQELFKTLYRLLPEFLEDSINLLPGAPEVCLAFPDLALQSRAQELLFPFR